MIHLFYYLSQSVTQNFHIRITQCHIHPYTSHLGMVKNNPISGGLFLLGTVQPRLQCQIPIRPTFRFTWSVWWLNWLNHVEAAFLRLRCQFFLLRPYFCHLQRHLLLIQPPFHSQALVSTIISVAALGSPPVAAKRSRRCSKACIPGNSGDKKLAVHREKPVKNRQKLEHHMGYS